MSLNILPETVVYILHATIIADCDGIFQFRTGYVAPNRGHQYNECIKQTGKGANMIGIIGAMDIEVERFRDVMDASEVISISGIDFYRGTIGNSQVVVAKCGIGKVFAAICAEAMIIHFNPQVIINTGAAGGLSPDLNIADIAVATGVVQHDMDTSPLGDPVGLISGINKVVIPADQYYGDKLTAAARELGLHCVRGIIASGDTFVATNQQRSRIRDSFEAIACEMEGAAVGQVCYVNNVPFVILRSISDSSSDSATMEYPEFVKIAANNSFAVIQKMLSEKEV